MFSIQYIYLAGFFSHIVLNVFSLGRPLEHIVHVPSFIYSDIPLTFLFVIVLMVKRSSDLVDI